MMTRCQKVTGMKQTYLYWNEAPTQGTSMLPVSGNRERSPLGDVNVACKRQQREEFLGNESEKRNFDFVQSAAGAVISGVRKRRKQR